MYINNIFIVYDNGWDWVVYLKSVENVITLGKLIGLLFLFCVPLFSILFFKTKRNDLARPVIGRAKRDPPPPHHLGLDFHIMYIIRTSYVRY